MAIEKLISIHTALIESGCVLPEQISSWSEEGDLELSIDNLGEGFQLSRYEYDGFIQIRNFSGSASVLLAVVSAWIIENDPDRDRDGLSAPEIDVRPVDNKRTEVDIEIRFQERVYITEDISGPILFRGKRYRVGEPEIYFPDEICVSDQTGFVERITSESKP